MLRHFVICLLLVMTAGAATGDPPSPKGAQKLVVATVYLRLIDQVDVPAQAAGVLERLLTQEGRRVAPGDPLMQLNAEDAELTLERARLELEAARQAAGSDARIQQAKSAVEEARSLREKSRIEREISVKKSTNDVLVRAAKKAEAVANAELKRALAARREVRDSVSENELDHLQLTADKAKFDVEQAEHDLAVAGLTAQMKAADESGLVATVARREAELAQAEEDQRGAQLAERAKSSALRGIERELARRTIRAPIAGEVVTTYRRTGEWVEPGERVLRIVRLDRLRAEGFLPAADARRELLGAAVKFVVTIRGKSREFPGQISFISPEIDPVNDQALVWAEIENPEPDLPLRPGMSGGLSIHPK